MTCHARANIIIIAGCEVSVVYHGTLLDVDGVGDVLIAAVNSVVGLVSLVLGVFTEGVLDLTCVQAFYIPRVSTSKQLFTELIVTTRADTLAHYIYWQTCRRLLPGARKAGLEIVQMQGGVIAGVTSTVFTRLTDV